MAAQDNVPQKRCVITDQLIELAKKGYKLPWIGREGIAPFNKMILEELVKKPSVPGSFECLRKLETEFGVDPPKLQAAAAEVLRKGEYLQTFNFCRVAIKALENEIEHYVDEDVDWSEVLLARYAGCVIKERCCHVESVNDLLTVIYDNDKSFSGTQEQRILHLMRIVKAWKSGVVCGTIEECFKMQERCVGRAQPLCSDFIDTISNVSRIYGDIKEIRASITLVGSDTTPQYLEEQVLKLATSCENLIGIIRRITPIYDEEDAA